jgi:hypothetical protein
MTFRCENPVRRAQFVELRREISFGHTGHLPIA